MNTAAADYVRVNENPWSGWIHADFQAVPIDLLAEPDHASDGFERVQSSATAEVYRYNVEVKQTPVLFYLKRHLRRSVLDAIKHLIRPGRAKRAFHAGLMLQKHQIDTPQIAAFLQKKKGLVATEDILITRGIVNPVSIATVLGTNAIGGSTINLRTKRLLLAELGKTIGRMHAAGICHGDLRAGNILVRAVADGFRFTFIDNERTAKYPVLLPRLRRKNLVQLNMLGNTVGATDRMRFWRAYVRSAAISRRRARAIAGAVTKRTRARLKKKTRVYTGLRHACDRMAAIKRFRCGDCSGYMLEDLYKGGTESLVRQVEELTARGTVLKDDTATRVVHGILSGRHIVIKRYNHQGLWHSLRHTIKGSRALKCWQFGYRLLSLGVDCAQPLAAVEKRRWGLVWESYIINDFIDGPNIKDFFHMADVPEAAKDRMLKKVHLIAAKLLENGLIHNDLKSYNLLIAGDTAVLIDLDSMREHRNRWILSFYKGKMDRKIENRIASERRRG